MSKVYEAAEAFRKQLHKGTEPPDNGGMEQRIAALEKSAQETRDRLTSIETRLHSLATREDLYKAINDQTWKIIGAVITLGTVLSGIVFFIARNVR